MGHYTRGPQAEGPCTELLEFQGLGGSPLNKTFGTELYSWTVTTFFPRNRRQTLLSSDLSEAVMNDSLAL